MRANVTLTCIFWTSCVTAFPVDEHPRPERKSKPFNSLAVAALREASEIALDQESHQHSWRRTVLLSIGNAQTRAGDFDGALRSFGPILYDYGLRTGGPVQLAEALARNGQTARALHILSLLDRKGYSEDNVYLHWIEHLLASGDLGRAGNTIEKLAHAEYRSKVHRKIAVAHAQSGNAVLAAEQFTRALNAAGDLSTAFASVQTMCEIADAQLSVGQIDAAQATIRQLIERGKSKDAWINLFALCKAAALSAKANNTETAQRLFRQALVGNHEAVHTAAALRLIATCQAGVGFIDDAQKTAWTIKHSDKDSANDGYREQALYEIAVAQLELNDVEGAIRTSLSVDYFLQYRDDALRKIVEHQIAKGDLKAALITAGMIDSPPRKAAAILKVATAHVHAGDRRAATNIAGRIELTQRDDDAVEAILGNERFDYRQPRSWGVCYGQRYASTISSYEMQRERAAEVATAAMEFAQALGQRPAQSYTILFSECNEDAAQALAYAHALWGDPIKALVWSRQIGSGGKVKSNEDPSYWGVQRRIHALLGVAEGILARSLEDKHDSRVLLPRQLQTGELESYWTDLATGNPAQARRAISKLVAAPQETVPCLRNRLKPAPLADRGKIQRWIRELDSDSFTVRQAATKELAMIGEQVQIAIREALKGEKPLESRRRLEQILNTLPDDSGPDTMRTVRAVMVLEKIGSPEAQGVLECLAGGAPGARVTEAAKEALERLAQHAAFNEFLHR
jgi:tetratricopeptide (TPR) repeat protein